MIPLLIGNVLALIASLLMVYAGLVKKREKILFLQIVQNVLGVASNIVLGGYPGAIVNALSAVRTTLCFKDKLKIKVQSVFIIVTAILILKFNNLGLIGLLPLISTTVYTIFMNTKDVVKFKMVIIFTMLMWLTYDITIRSYASVGFEIMNIVTNIIAITQLKFKREKTDI